jgi:hypothetical protein
VYWTGGLDKEIEGVKGASSLHTSRRDFWNPGEATTVWFPDCLTLLRNDPLPGELCPSLGCHSWGHPHRAQVLPGQHLAGSTC